MKIYDDNGYVDIKIVNSDGVTVYDKGISFTKDDFDFFSDDLWDYDFQLLFSQLNH